jgi:hypothetical protein
VYDVKDSAINATLSDSGAVTIHGVTSDGANVALIFNSTFWANSTAFSQLGVQDEHTSDLD